MNLKKTGIWAGGFIGLFVILLILTYFLYPYLNPDKADKVRKQVKSKVKTANFEPNLSGLQNKNHPAVGVDSLSKLIMNQRAKIDSLKKKDKHRKQVIDSLTQALKNEKELMKKIAEKQQHLAVSVKKASKSLLQLDDKELAPIVNLLNQSQLMNLYENSGSRQREKLLRTLEPKKAAAILKEVMK
jgi:Mg/Co/Ni transporter MgtE